jgi:endonuclease/exonuclease/phosphatase (EEP) superfamily protein YafD
MSTLEEARAVGASDEPPAPATARRRPRRWVARLLTVALALWTVFVAAFYVLTGRYWWWRPVELMPSLLFVAVPLLLLVLTPLTRVARIRLAVAALCCVLLGVPLVGFNVYALPGLGGGSATPPGAVKVFSWNTEYWDDSDDPDEFYAYLKAQHADVYLLQERVSWDVPGHRPIRADHVAELKSHFPGYHVVATGEVLTMSRYPVEHWRGLDNWPYMADIGMPPDNSYPDYYRYKVLRTDLRINGRVMTFYNIHVPVQLDISMDPASRQFTEFMKAQQARRQATYDALEHDLRGNRLPVMVAGDMNGDSAMGELRELGSRLRDALPANDQFLPRSWPAADLPLPQLWRLDWAFTSDSVKVHTYRFEDSKGMSDHRAQVLTLSPPAD